MAKQKARFYAVGRGKEVGVYHSWAQCNEQVHGWSGARYQGFQTYEKAQEFVMQHDWDYRLQHEKRAATFQQQIRSGLGGGDSYQDAIVFDSDDDEDSVWEDGAVVAQVTIDEDDDEEALVESSLGSAVLHNSITQHRDDDNTMHQDQHVNLIQQDGKSFQTAFTIEDDHDDDRQIRKTHLHRRVELGKSMQRAIIIEDSDEDDDSGDSDIIPFEIHRYDGQRKRVIKASIRRKTRVAVRSVGRGPEYRRHRKSVRQQAKLKARSDHTIKRAKLMAALSLSSSGSITSIQARIIEVYTDGSCVKKGKGGAKAGWGVYWPDHRDVNSDMYELNEHGRVPGDGSKQTSDRAELLGVIQAIRLCPDDSAQLVIWTDSRYCINALGRRDEWNRKSWIKDNGKAVKNRDYIEWLYKEMASRFLRPKLDWVKGHANIKGNCEADKLAKMGRMLAGLPSPPCSDMDESSDSEGESEGPDVGQHDVDHQDTSEAEICTSLA